MADINLKALEALYASVTIGQDHPPIIVCDARSEQGQYILTNRDGEEAFDGFWHAYIRRGDQTFYVPLTEIV